MKFDDLSSKFNANFCVSDGALLVCAGRSESFKFANSIGVGLVESAINLTKILSNLKNQNSVDEVIFIGTAGLYGRGNLGEIYESKTATNIEISSILGLSYSPLLTNAVSYETDKNVINSSNFITQNAQISAKFSALGLFMENMEFFAVTNVAKAFKTRSRGVFCATNFCNENAHADFMKNHENAKKELEIYLKNKGII